MRINKFLAKSGVASRRAAEKLILDGRVQVNNAVVRDLATIINESDSVTVDGKSISVQEEKVYIIMNKPLHCVTTCSDQFGRKTVLDVLKENYELRTKNSENNQSSIINHKSVRVFPVGRLDYDTEGLLILTNDGEFAKAVTHPSSQIKKTYIARLDRRLNEAELEELRNGVCITHPVTRDASDTPLHERGTHSIQPSMLNTQHSILNSKKTAPAQIRLVKNLEYEITIHEGRNRQVRKMFAAVGSRVLHLKRVAIGNLKLGNLKSGEWEVTRRAPTVKDF